MNFILIFKKIKSKIGIFKRTSINLFYIFLIFLLSQKNKIHYKIKNSNILIVRIDGLGDIFLSLHQAYEIKKNLMIQNLF